MFAYGPLTRFKTVFCIPQINCEGEGRSNSWRCLGRSAGQLRSTLVRVLEIQDVQVQWICPTHWVDKVTKERGTMGIDANELEKEETVKERRI